MPYDEDRNPGRREEPEDNESRGDAGAKGVREENGREENSREERYSFLRETIKPKPISREKLIREFVRIAVYGLILGVFACLGFFALRPWAQGWFQDNPRTVTIPEDEETPEEQTGNEEEEEPEQPVFDVQSYEEIMDSLYDTAEEAQKGIASVSRVSAENDWSSSDTGIRDSVAGVVTADNGRELLVLADSSVCTDADSWSVTFRDGTEYPASLKRQDRNTGLAVFSVARNSLSDSTWNSVEVAVLGNSNSMRQGDAVFALGNMFGYADGLGYGIISSDDYKETFYDGECDVLATDIAAVRGGTGVLFNLKGEVVGLIPSSLWEDTSGNMVNAYGISDLKSVIEMFANGESVPYIGITGAAVTSEVQEERGIPEGIYVKDVDADSPAMQAGIQSGDVIREINGEEVTNMAAYRNALLEINAGDSIRIRGRRLGAGGYVDVVFSVTVGSKE